MRDSNLSAVRRLESLEARLDATERALASQSQRARSWQWPRDTWLGRTYSDSPGSYPTEGDTFQVKLLSCHFTASEGTQAVTESERGTIVTARTWPEKYLPRDTEVVVKRMRGIGPNGAGEWWIETSESSGGNLIVVGDTDWEYIGAPQYYRNTGTVEYVADGIHPDIPRPDVDPNSGLWVVPSFDGKFTDGGAEVIEAPVPANWQSPAVRLHGMTRYRLSVHTTWLMPSMNSTDADYWLSFGIDGHIHQYVQNNVAYVTQPAINGNYKWRVVGDFPINVATYVRQSIAWNEARSEIELGVSSLYASRYGDGQIVYQSHSGCCLLAPPNANGNFPKDIRFRVAQRTWAYGAGYPFTVALHRLQATIERVSD